MTPEQLSHALTGALTALVAEGAVSLDEVPTAVTVERPRSKEHGDYATNVALQLAKRAGTPPRALAELLADRLRADPGIEAVEIAGPGFLNITVAAAAQGQVAAEVVAAGAAYGHTETLAGQKINVEFISANPTGPLHLGHTRWAVVGDAIARVIEAAGAEVTREFYINDRGNQMDLFGASIEARALGRPVPDDGYQGAYVQDLADAIVAADPGILVSGGRGANRGVPRGGLRPAAEGAAGPAGGLPHPLRRVVLRAVAAPERRRGRRPGQAARPGSPLRRRRGAVDAHHRLRRRQGPGADPVQRRADLLRQRHGLLRRQAAAWFRPADLPAGRRPPRLRRPAAGDGRLCR